jgi:hypothetical protein
MDKPEQRQAEANARHKESQAVADARHKESNEWRDTVRKEDKVWRKRVREEDREWRDKARAEDGAWRDKVRQEDIDHRLRNERTTARCAALSAAVLSSKQGTPPDEVFALARKFEEWVIG